MSAEAEALLAPNVASAALTAFADLLNEALDLDQEAVTALFKHRVACNEGLADHPTIQVGSAYFHRVDQPGLDLPPDARTTLSILGLLNGLFPTPASRLAAVYQLVCDRCGKENVPEHAGLRAGETCPLCGGMLRTGKIVRFDRYEVKP